jgi:hypothetical protein
MAIIGFIVMFLIMCYFSFMWVVALFVQKGLSGFRKYDFIGYILALGIILLGWYYLFKDITISVGGI